MYNKIILQGNLSKDIEIRYSQGGSAIANTAIATTRKFKAQDGTQKEEVLFVDVTFFGRTAEIANQYLRKGSKVLLDGRLKLDQWTDKQGQKRSKHSVSIENLTILDSKPTDGQSAAQNQATQPQQNKPPTQEAYTPPPRATDNNYAQSIPQQGTHDQQPTQTPQFSDMEDEIPF